MNYGYPALVDCNESPVSYCLVTIFSTFYLVTQGYLVSVVTVTVTMVTVLG